MTGSGARLAAGFDRTRERALFFAGVFADFFADFFAAFFVGLFAGFFAGFLDGGLAGRFGDMRRCAGLGQ